MVSPALLRPWHREALQLVPVTTALLLTNLIIFVVEEAWGGSRSIETLQRMGAIVSGADHVVPRAFAYGFLHIGVVHVAVNMLGLWNLGVFLEPILGRAFFALLYFGSLLAGGLGITMFVGVGITAGASGALFGLLAAVSVLIYARFRSTPHPYERALMRNQLLWLVVPNAIISFLPGVSLTGHAAGFVFGLMFMGGLRALAPFRDSPAVAARIRRAATVLSLAATVASASSLAIVWHSNRPWIVTDSQTMP